MKLLVESWIKMPIIVDDDIVYQAVTDETCWHIWNEIRIEITRRKHKL